MDLNDQSRGKSGLHFIFYQVLVHDPHIFTWGLRGSNRIQLCSYNYRISKIKSQYYVIIFFFKERPVGLDPPFLYLDKFTMNPYIKLIIHIMTIHIYIDVYNIFVMFLNFYYGDEEDVFFLH